MNELGFSIGIGVCGIALVLLFLVIVGVIRSARVNVFLILIMGVLIGYGTYLVISSA